ncbi:hypothetical protein B5G06_03250 [Flavonifractor sp. An52]|uniref:ATP-binding cassette domain-containing protein n=1 Tax=Flavonifractor sp. An52 TaxID=1965642 RepID=UPI000B3AFE37|nr:ATP-binding cassette domain-containing protein [Flavonifractor sp. An52]OUN85340.1 hypothetical protein B5G06_03250 [Flavonifractor sp. An52]
MRREVLSGRNLTFHNRAGCIISNVSLHLYQGEILGIVGINGPGKTILAQLLAGILQPDSGKIVLGEVGQGEQASSELLRARVGYVGEEPELLENLTVAENLMIGIQAEPWLYASRKRLYQKAKVLLEKHGFEADPKARVSALTYTQCKEVQLARQLVTRPNILVLDDLAESFSSTGQRRLADILRTLAQAGSAIIYTSHRYEDLLPVVDRLLVLRAGMVVAESQREQFCPDRIRRLLYGGDPLATSLPVADRAISHQTGEEVLRLSEVRAASLKPVSFSVRRGEIVGIAGLVGSGKSILVQCIGGHRPIEGGRLYIQGRRCVLNSPRDAVKHGIGLCLERHSDMLQENASIMSNISLSVINRVGTFGILSRKKERLLAAEYCTLLEIPHKPDERLAVLSDSDAAKVALARCMAASPLVLVLDEPNRELDPGGVQRLCALLHRLRNTCGIVVSFSKMDDLAACCDRILILHEGTVIGETRRNDLSYADMLRMIEKGGEQPE